VEIRPSSLNLKPNIIEVAANERGNDKSFLTGVHPSGGTHLRCAVVRAPVLDLAKDRDCSNSGQHRERGNGPRRSKRPHRLEASETRGQAGFDTFANRQSDGHILVSVEFDRAVLGAAQHFTFKRPTNAAQKRPMDTARLVGRDISKERNHRTYKHAVEL
jgi:hypothetical protein